MSNTNEANAPDNAWAKLTRVLLTLLFSLFAIMLFCVLYAIWPRADGQTTVQLQFFGHQYGISQEQQYFLLMLFGGALGATLQVIISFTAFIGNKAFVPSWIPWYCLRPLVGGGLAVIFYLLIRGGLMSYAPPQSQPAVSRVITTDSSKATTADSLGDTTGSRNISTSNKQAMNAGQQTNTPVPATPIPLNPFGLMSIACLAGLFSKVASKKLEEVFETLFNVKAENKVPYKDKLPTDPQQEQPATSAAPVNNNDATHPDADIHDILPDADTNNTDESQPQG
ncbi:MAG: hypothetical protein BGO69_01705 [Bacteroidetes bacterium 46-16]|nr:MAG: hypothetical protein BGO69_01705 [Bacteroidetes bacterium 46-16]